MIEITNKQENRKKICLLGASFDTGNLGVSALAESSIKVILHQWPNAEVILLGSGRVESEHSIKISGREMLIRNVPLRLSKKNLVSNHFCVLFAYSLLFKIFRWDGFKRFFTRRNRCLRDIVEADMVADITGGDSFSDIYGMRRFIKGCLNKLLIIQFGKTLVMLPQTYGPFEKKTTKFLARYILKRIPKMYARDQQSLGCIEDILKNNGMVRRKIQFVPDVAFVLDPCEPENTDIDFLKKRNPETILVGLNISGLLFSRGYTRNNMFGLKPDYHKLLCGIIEMMMKKKDVIILLIPHLFARNGTIENDFDACSTLHETFSQKYRQRIYLSKRKYDQAEIKYLIGRCDFFLGSRMHSCIAALSQLIPAVGLAYSKKFAGVFDSVGVGNLVIDLREETEQTVLSIIDECFSKRRQFVEKLSETIPQAQEVVLKLFSSN